METNTDFTCPHSKSNILYGNERKSLYHSIAAFQGQCMQEKYEKGSNKELSVMKDKANEQI